MVYATRSKITVRAQTNTPDLPITLGAKAVKRVIRLGTTTTHHRANCANILPPPWAKLALLAPIVVGGSSMLTNHAAVAITPTTPTAMRVAPAASFGSLTTTAVASAAPLLQATTVAVALTIFVLGLQGALRGAPHLGQQEERSKPLTLTPGGLPKPEAPELGEDGALSFFHAGRYYVVRAA